MNPRKVLFVTAEMAPLAKTGGLGDVLGALPPRLLKAGLDVRVIMPLYKRIKEKYAKELTFQRCILPVPTSFDFAWPQPALGPRLDGLWRWW